MAHETLLRMIVNGLQNLAMDQQTLFEHLNLRVLARQFDETFEGASYNPPVPPYPDVAASQTDAANLVATIAGNSALLVVYLGGEPASPVMIDDQTADADLLRLAIDWGTIQSGVQKAIIQLYGPQPGPPPGLPHPGAASEQRLWAEIVAWLQKIAADSSAIGNSPKSALKTSKRRIGATGTSGSIASPQTVMPEATKLASTMRSTNIVCKGCRRRIRPMFPDSKSPRVQIKNDRSCAVTLSRNFSSAGWL